MPKTPAVRRPPGQRFLHWLALAAKQTRETARASTLQVAILADLQTDATVKRFEQGKHWPVDPETLIAAYAAASGVQDPRSIFELAIDLWHERGEAPHLSDPPDDAFGWAVRPEPAPKGSPSGRGQIGRATPRRRANG